MEVIWQKASATLLKQSKVLSRLGLGTGVSARAHCLGDAEGVVREKEILVSYPLNFWVNYVNTWPLLQLRLKFGSLSFLLRKLLNKISLEQEILFILGVID